VPHGLADVRILVVELDVVVGLDPDQLPGPTAASYAAWASSGRSASSVVPWTIRSGVGATSGAWLMALNVRYGSSEAAVVFGDHAGAWSTDVRA
jgi:hypothetical protein